MGLDSVLSAWTLAQRTFEPFLFTRVRAAWGGGQWACEGGEGGKKGEMEAGEAVFVGLVQIILSLHSAVAQHER